MNFCFLFYKMRITVHQKVALGIRWNSVLKHLVRWWPQSWLLTNITPLSLNHYECVKSPYFGSTLFHPESDLPNNYSLWIINKSSRKERRSLCMFIFLFYRRQKSNISPHRKIYGPYLLGKWYFKCTALFHASSQIFELFSLFYK